MKLKEVFILNEKNNKSDNSIYQTLESFIMQNVHDLNIDIIKQMIEKEIFLYRGLSTSSSKNKMDWFCDYPRDKRFPRDTVFYKQILLDKIFDLYDIEAKRSNSFFCTGDFEMAKYYGQYSENNVFIVLPSKNFSFYSNEIIRDLFAHEDEILRSLVEDLGSSLTREEIIKLLTNSNLTKTNIFLIDFVYENILQEFFSDQFGKLKLILTDLFKENFFYTETAFCFFVLSVLSNKEDEKDILKKLKNYLENVNFKIKKENENFIKILYNFIKFVFLTKNNSVVFNTENVKFGFNVQKLRSEIINKFRKHNLFYNLILSYSNASVPPEEKEKILSFIFDDLLFNENNINNRKYILRETIDLFIKKGITNRNDFMKAIKSGNEILLRGKTCFIRNLYKDMFIDIFKKMIK